MKNLLLLMGVFCLLLFSSCNYHNSGELVKFRYNAENTTFNWTAYKYSEKVGVKGTFDQINVTGCVEAFHPMDVIAGLNFEINTESINTGSEFRDNNILNFFFVKLINWDRISGSFIDYEGNFETGKMRMNIRMNNVDHPVEFEYDFNNSGLFQAATSIHLADFYGEEALDNMENCCVDFHTGQDGVHLLWPDIAFNITAQFEAVD